MSNLIFIGVDYEEFQPDTYKGVTVDRNEEHYLFDQGKTPRDDLNAAYEFIGEEKFAAGLVCNMSSVDDFPMDGGDWDKIKVLNKRLTSPEKRLNKS
jgi:hypothetical protein